MQFSNHSKPWIPQHTRKANSDLKSYLMMMMEDFKKDINNFHKEIQDNTGKQKSLKELQENTTKQMN